MTPTANSSNRIPGAAILALAFAAFASGISLRLTDPLLPLFAREFAISPGQAAAVITSFSVPMGCRNCSSARSATASVNTA